VLCPADEIRVESASGYTRYLSLVDQRRRDGENSNTVINGGDAMLAAVVMKVSENPSPTDC